MGLFGFLDKLMEKLPIQSRIERMRNQRDKAIAERELLVHKRWSAKRAKRILDLNDRIAELNRLLANRE